jgi:hypothetical protein
VPLAQAAAVRAEAIALIQAGWLPGPEGERVWFLEVLGAALDRVRRDSMVELRQRGVG